MPEQPLSTAGSPDGPSTDTLTTRAKYNLMLPITMNITALASCHGTEQFLKYLAWMKKVEETVRAGASFLLETLDAPSTPLLVVFPSVEPLAPSVLDY